MKKRTGRNRILRREIVNSTVLVLTGKLEIHSENEALKGFASGLGFSESVEHAIIGSGENVVEFSGGFEPVGAGGGKKVVAAGGFLTVGEVVLGTEREDVAGRGGPTVGSGVEVDVAERSTIDGLGNPIGGGGGFAGNERKYGGGIGAGAPATVVIGDGTHKWNGVVM